MKADLHQNLIGGDWSGDDAVPNINPSDTRDVVGLYAIASKDDTRQACDAATAAFASWSMTSPQVRFDLLDRVGTLILERKQALGTLLAREEGKILVEAIGEVTRAGQIFKFFAGEAVRMTGDTVPSIRPGIDVEVTREPVGPIAIITPWNFPIAIPAWKIAPALAFGNTVVFKPAELVPGCAWALVDILREAGAPPGVVNLVMGRGSVIGNALVDHPGIAAVTFTGSVPTGRSIAARCAAIGKRVQCEMGGKNPVVVLDDARLDIAVESVANSAFYSTGQRCTASSRIIVTPGIHDRFVAALRDRMAALQVGAALDPASQIGPVVDQRQFDQNLRYVAIGRDEGAGVVGGAVLERATKGFFFEPALLLDTNQSMRVNNEEIFGPVASVIRVADLEEATAVANAVDFGLSAGICTTSLDSARYFKRRVAAGMVMVNLPTAGVDYHVPFGGRKSSSFGPREQGSYAREFYTAVKTSYIG